MRVGWLLMKTDVDKSEESESFRKQKKIYIADYNNNNNWVDEVGIIFSSEIDIDDGSLYHLNWSKGFSRQIPF